MQAKVEVPFSKNSVAVYSIKSKQKVTVAIQKKSVVLCSVIKIIRYFYFYFLNLCCVQV